MYWYIKALKIMRRFKEEQRVRSIGCLHYLLISL